MSSIGTLTPFGEVIPKKFQKGDYTFLKKQTDDINNIFRNIDSKLSDLGNRVSNLEERLLGGGRRTRGKLRAKSRAKSRKKRRRKRRKSRRKSKGRKRRKKRR